MTIPPELLAVLGAAGGALVTKAVPALWRRKVAQEEGEKTVLREQLRVALADKATVQGKLDSRDRLVRRLELFAVALWTSYRAKHQVEADAYRAEMPSSVGEIADAVTKDPFPELEGWDPVTRTPKPPAG